MAVKQSYSSITMAIAAAVEGAINAALRYDPASKRAVSKLTDILAIEVIPVTMPALTLFCTGTAQGLSVMSHCPLPVTTCLSGSPIALFGLLQRPHSLANTGVKLSGDTRLLQRWQAVLDNLEIDWEECLQDHLGDIAGPVTATAMSKVGHWLQHQLRYHQRQLSVYLQEELRVVPAKAEFDHFHRQVDELIFATDRLDARIQQLHATLHSTTSNNVSVNNISINNTSANHPSPKNLVQKNPGNQVT